LLLILAICPVFAMEYYVVRDLDKIFTKTDEINSNAICFFYPQGKFKCACKEPVTLKVWTSGDISRIKGFAQSKSYGIIQDCRDVDFKLEL